MSYESLDDSVAIFRMANALRGYVYIESAFIRAAAYDAFDVQPADISRYDRKALFTEQTRRKLFGIVGASVIAMAPSTAAYAGDCAAHVITWGDVALRVFATFGAASFVLAAMFIIAYLALGPTKTIKGIIEIDPAYEGDDANVPHGVENHR